MKADKERGAKSSSRQPDLSSMDPVSSSSAFPPVLRKASCACGGGCSSCKSNPSGLKISQPNDTAELEADRIADHVMRMSIDHPSHREMRRGSPSHAVGTDAEIVHRKCDSCAEEERDEVIQRKEANVAASGSPEPPPRSGGVSVGRAISSGGSPLDAATRGFFEPRLGVDLGNVRVHTGVSAAESASAINARAYTVGGNIVFGKDQYHPWSDSGKHLIAHELAHVVQQDREPALQRMIFRSSCPHDEPFGSGCGIFEWKGPENLLPDFVQAGTDRIITAALPHHLGGTWVPQLHSPPNLAKGGKSHGFVDAAKVDTSSGLSVEVLEIKSRNTNNGGCALATSETSGYITALAPLGTHIITISTGLAKVGGLRTAECRNITAAEKKTLVAAGLDINNPDSVRAWCLYNDLQNKLNRTFVSGFATVSFAPNKDGTAKTDYLVSRVPITCKRGKKTVAGIKKLYFQVNTKGGLSYRCDKRCGDQPDDEEEKEKVKDKPIELELPADKQLRGIEQPDSEDDWDPMEDDIRLPPEGIDVTDVVIVTTVGIATVATLHALIQKSKNEAEKKALKALAEKTIDKMAKRGASQAARQLNSHNIKKIGTKAYQEAIRKAEKVAAERLARTTEEKVAKRLAARMSKQAAKQGAKTIFKAAGRALPLVSLVLFAADAYAAVDAVSKGAELEIGLSGSEADLGSDTDIKIKGDKPKGDVTSDVKTEQTEIDVEMSKLPDVKGLVELETKQVKIKGKVDGSDGDPVTVNLKVKIQNTTIIYKSAGRFKGGNIVVDGGLELTDSEIEIDLPPDAVLDQPEPGQQKVLKGVKMRVTKLGSGGTAPEEGQGTGAGGETTDKEPAEKKDKPPEPSEERKKLLSEVQADPGVKKIYDTIIKPKGIPITDEVLRRLLAVKEQLKQHPELVDRVISKLEKGGLQDPIKDLIEPMEAEIKQALEEKTKKQEPTPAPQTGTPADPAKDKDVAPATTTPQTTPPPVDPCKDAEKLSLWGLIDAVNAKSLPSDTAVRLGEKKFTDEEGEKPTETAAAPVILGRKTPDGLRSYTIWVHGKDMKPLKSFDRKRFIWAADYEFTAPGGPFKSDQGDRPICFTDGGTSKRMTWGRLVSTKKK